MYTEEIIDFKLLRTYRYVNGKFKLRIKIPKFFTVNEKKTITKSILEVLKTVDFIDKFDGTIVFRTCEAEKGKVIIQIGTASAERALNVAKMVENDVSAIDINMGYTVSFEFSVYQVTRCRKVFSLKFCVLSIPKDAQKRFL